MFKKFIERARQQRREDLEAYHRKVYSLVTDEAAKAVRWLPLAEGGASRRTYTLQKTGPGRYQFQPGLTLKILAHAPLVLGAALVVRLIYRVAVAEDIKALWVVLLFWGAVAAVLIISGLFAWRHIYSAPRVDFVGRRAFRRHIPMPALFERFFPAKHYFQAGLDDVLAIQVLAEHCSSQDDSGSQSFVSYEMNLVLKKNNRILLVDHGDLGVIQSDAKTLSALMGVPVWDASGCPLDSTLIRPF